MATLTFYFREGMTQEEANEIRRQLNNIAATLGYVAQRGPTKGQGNAATLLVAIAKGEINLVHSPTAGSEVEHQKSSNEEQQTVDPLEHLQTTYTTYNFSRLPSRGDLDQAIEDILAYSRGTRLVLLKGRILAPFLLGTNEDLKDWDQSQDWLLKEAFTKLINMEILRLRQAHGIEIPLSTNAVEHAKALLIDTRGSKPLRMLSLLWAYYICQMTSTEIGNLTALALRSVQGQLQSARSLLSTTIFEIFIKSRSETSRSKDL